jgi:hypothetical protein
MKLLFVMPVTLTRWAGSCIWTGMLPHGKQRACKPAWLVLILLWPITLPLPQFTCT